MEIVKTLFIKDIQNCPSLILLPSHYREDGTCRHDEPVCEENDCHNLKHYGEIYCKHHLEAFGYEEDD